MDPCYILDWNCYQTSYFNATYLKLALAVPLTFSCLQLSLMVFTKSQVLKLGVASSHDPGLQRVYFSIPVQTFKGYPLNSKALYKYIHWSSKDLHIIMIIIWEPLLVKSPIWLAALQSGILLSWTITASHVLLHRPSISKVQTN